MCHPATYSHRKTALYEIIKDMGILDLQLRNNQRMREGVIREGGEQGCHVELTENCTTPQRKITWGTNGKLVRLSFFLLLLLHSPFYCILPLNLCNILQNPFCSLTVLQWQKPLFTVPNDAEITGIDALASMHLATWAQTTHTHTKTHTHSVFGQYKLAD